MVNIPLRTYEKKIEEMIGQNLLQEAVVHSKHILGTYPKNISTYRLIGQAFLEGKRYSEAADVFNRVLAVFPDDFISHVGMSIVRENENNLDAAIWHMELAFDNQPSNITIQEELKRLFGRRDGTHPAKIRLTRGALVRMYARGELYQQAITEIKSALTEELKRFDLEVFLAKMYYLSSEQNEATDLCRKLVKELPYCYEVNKILAETSPGNSDGKPNTWKNRLCELDPYETYVNARFPEVANVPDDKVMVNELTDLVAIELAKETAWSSNLDDEWKKEPSVTIPENIPQKAPFNASDLQGTAIEGNPKAEIPTFDPFMEQSGSQETSKVPEGTKPEDWLPSSLDENQQSEEDQTSAPSAPQDLPDWLSSLAPQDEGSAEQNTPELQQEDPFSEIKQKVTEGQKADAPAIFETESIGNPAFTPSEETTAVDASDLPDWLKNFETDETGEPVSRDDLPDWLNSLQGPEAIPGADAVSAFQESSFGAGPENSFDTGTVEETAPALESEPVSEFAAQQEIVSEQESPAKTSPDADIAPNEEVPDWIRSLKISDDQPENERTSADNAIGFEPEHKDTVETGMADAFQQTPDETISEKSGDELLEWLRDLEPTDSSTAPAEETSEDISINTDNLAYDFDAELQKLNQLTGSTNSEPIASADEKDTFSFTQTEPTPEPAGEPAETAILREELSPSAADLPFNQISGQDVAQLPEIEPETPLQNESSPSPEPVYVENDLDALAKMLSSGAPVAPILQRLEAISEEKPEDYFTWQLLGDAYAKSNRYSDALSAYSRAEKILISMR